MAVATAPTTDLCTPTGGTPSIPSGPGPWTWTCLGSGTGHTDDSCSAPLISKPVINTPIISPDYCFPKLGFSWNYPATNTYPQAFYKIDIYDSNAVWNSSTGYSGNLIYSTNKLNSASVSIEKTLLELDLSYNSNYKWQVRVWDSIGATSDFLNGGTFSTPAHAYPTASFSFTPQSPIVKQKVSFNADGSQCYNGRDCLYLWNFGDPDYSTPDNPNTSTLASPNHDYKAVNPYDVVQDVYDSCVTFADCNSGLCESGKCVGYYCRKTGTVNVKKQANVPEWREISPF